jgi:hypothetical protein
MSGPERDLERIEAALAEGVATADDPRERELQELALAIQADSPKPTPVFTQRMERRLSDGFPKPKRALPRFLLPTLAAATAVIAVAVIAISSGGGNGEHATSVASKTPTDRGGEALSAAPFRDAAPATATDRKVERSVELTISTTKDKLQDAADGVGTVAEDHGGFVLTSHVNTGDGPVGGSFTLRVPQRELQATIADISKLGHLEARSESGQDMTASFNDVQDKLGNALLERRALKLKLRHAKGAKADAIRIRIATLNSAIDSLNGQMHDLKRRTSYSTVNVTLEEQKGQSGGGTGAAWDDARGTLEGMLNFSVRALGVLLPLGLIAGLAGLGGRSLRRRRREAPLL